MFRKIIFSFFFITGFLYAQENFPTHKPIVMFNYDLRFGKLDTLNFSEQTFRRIFLGFQGDLYKNTDYYFRLNFSSGKVKIHGGYIRFKKLPKIGGNFLVGNIRAGASLEARTSSAVVSFTERAFVASTQPDIWRTGVKYENYNLLNKKVALELYYTFNEDRFNNTNFDNNRNYIARLVFVPIQKEDFILHLGTIYENRKFPDNLYAMKFREGEMSVSVSPIQYKLENMTFSEDLGGEFVLIWKRFLLQAEFQRSIFHIYNQPLTHINTYYGDLVFFLTDDNKSYKTGRFTGIRPKKPWNPKRKQYGAWFVALRYDVADFSRSLFLPTFLGQPIKEQMTHWIAGLGVYPTSHIRMRYNFVVADFIEGKSFYSHTMRVAYNF